MQLFRRQYRFACCAAPTLVLGTSVLAAPRTDSSLAPQRVVEIQNAYVRSFFSQELAGEESALLSGQQPEFPEVRLEIRRSIAEVSEP